MANVIVNSTPFILSASEVNGFGLDNAVSGNEQLLALDVNNTTDAPTGTNKRVAINAVPKVRLVIAEAAPALDANVFWIKPSTKKMSAVIGGAWEILSKNVVNALLSLSGSRGIITGTGPEADGITSTSTVIDYAGNLITCPGGMIRRQGGRLVRNLFATSDYSNAIWHKGAGITTAYNVAGKTGLNAVDIVIGSAGDTSLKSNFNANNIIRGSFALCFDAKSSGTDTFVFFIGSDAEDEKYKFTVNVTSDWQTFCVTALFSTTNRPVILAGIDYDSANFNKTITLDKLSLVYGNAAAEYVDPSITYNAGIAGAKWFDTQPANTVDVNGVVTEAVGAALPVKPVELIEPAALQLLVNPTLVGGGLNTAPTSWTTLRGGTSTFEPESVGVVMAYKFTAIDSYTGIYQGINLTANTQYLCYVDVLVNSANTTVDQVLLVSDVPAGTTIAYKFNGNPILPSSVLIGIGVLECTCTTTNSGSCGIRLGNGIGGGWTAGVITLSKPNFVASTVRTSFIPGTSRSANQLSVPWSPNIHGTSATIMIRFSKNVLWSEGGLFEESSEVFLQAEPLKYFLYKNTNSNDLLSYDGTSVNSLNIPGLSSLSDVIFAISISNGQSRLSASVAGGLAFTHSNLAPCNMLDSASSNNKLNIFIQTIKGQTLLKSLKIYSDAKSTAWIEANAATELVG
jgi:hypothetical protein